MISWPMSKISIHSTTRVETGESAFIRTFERISIHSTTRVETIERINTLPMEIFQSTPPRGWRHMLRVAKDTDILKISIHSTTRVETADALVCVHMMQISIHSTTRVETGNRGTAPLFMSFQSTPPRGWRQRKALYARPSGNFNPLHHEGGDRYAFEPLFNRRGFQSTPPRGWRQQYYTITTTILQHISTNKSYPTPSNHGQPSLHTRKSVLIVQIFRCESPRKSMFASGSHQNTLYRFTARGQVRISAVLPH